ncbi:MAG: endonuclease domain-containing protein [Anaerolineae bacterium]
MSDEQRHNTRSSGSTGNTDHAGGAGDGHPLFPSPAGRGARGEGKRLPVELLERARALRREATDAERLLWSLLRNRQLRGLKFRRQHPLGGYILDSYCHKVKLGIELDGGQHAEPEQAVRDAQRTRDLEELGIRVMRFWNHEVLEETRAVLEAIMGAVEEG